MTPRAAAAAAHAVGLTPIPVPPDHQRQASLSRADLGRAERERIAPHQLPRMRIAAAVDTAISMSSDRAGFLDRLRDLGVEAEVIKKSGGGEQGIRFRMAEEGARWWKGSGLGKAYSLRSLDRRLAGDVDQLVASQRFADRKRKSGLLEKLAREQQAGREIVKWSNGYVAAVATDSEIRWRTGSSAESSVCAALAKERGWQEMILADRGNDEKNRAAVEAYHRVGISVQLNGQRYPAPTSSVTQQMKGPVNGNDGRNPRASPGGSGAASTILGAPEVDGKAGERSAPQAQRHEAAARSIAPVLPSSASATGKALTDDQRHRPAGQETATPQKGEEQVDLLDFLNDPVGTRARAQRALEDLSEVNPGDHSARIVAEAHQPIVEAADPLDFLEEQSQPAPISEPEPKTATAQEETQSAPISVPPTSEDFRLAEDVAVAQLARYEVDMEGARPRTSAQIEVDLVASRHQREWHEMQSLIHRMKPSTMKEIVSLREREEELGIALALALKREAEARRQIRRDPAAMAAIHTRATGLAREREERKKADDLRRLTEKTKRELVRQQKEEEAERRRKAEENQRPAKKVKKGQKNAA